MPLVITQEMRKGLEAVKGLYQARNVAKTEAATIDHAIKEVVGSSRRVMGPRKANLTRISTEDLQAELTRRSAVKA